MKGHQPDAEEQAFLDSYDPHRFPKPAVTVDTVVLRLAGRGVQVLLIRRGHHPFRGCWALPGGFLDLDADETTMHGAARELLEETGVAADRLVEIGAFGRRGRDPRDRTVTVAYLALASGAESPVASDDAAACAWFDTTVGADGRVLVGGDTAVRLAFDHDDVIARALEELAWRAQLAAPFLELLDPHLSVSDAGAWLHATARFRAVTR
jgi:8-oxo-dGTP diphosphatase